MSITENWMMQQIKINMRFISRLVFKSDTVRYEMTNGETDLLYEEISNLLSVKKICEAEDLLHAKFEEGNEDFLRMALEFYSGLNEMDDKSLDKCNFSREEINEGLIDIVERYGIELPTVDTDI